MIEVRGYVDPKGNKPFALWLESLDARAAAKVTIVLARMEQLISQTLIILVGGGTKKRQQRDIETAQARWAEYKQRKKEEDEEESCR